MPDIDEILEILQRNVDDARERVSHILEERMPYLLEEEGLADVSATSLNEARLMTEETAAGK